MAAESKLFMCQQLTYSTFLKMKTACANSSMLVLTISNGVCPGRGCKLSRHRSCSGISSTVFHDLHWKYVSGSKPSNGSSSDIFFKLAKYKDRLASIDTNLVKSM